jgi:polysaccharide export outer membrane protein
MIVWPRLRDLGGTLPVLLVGGLLAPAVIAADAAPVVENLSLDARVNEVVITVKTTLPVPPFTCRLPSPTSSQAVLEVPGASSRLQPRYAVDSTLVPEVLVEAGSGGVRLRVGLGDAVLAVVEQAGNGIILRVTSRPVDPGRAAAAGAEYRVGIGDKLEISVFAHEDMSKVAEVRSDGTINYPLIGVLPVAGRTPVEIDVEITRLLAKDFLVDPQVSVEVRDYQSQWVTIIGEIKQPGRYVLKRNMRLVDLLAEAGGPTKEAGDEILVTGRQEEDGPPRHLVLDLERLLAGDNQGANVLLAHGDIVALGEKKVFYIRGEVRQPSSYFLEKGMTVLKAITVAGGLSQFANRKEIELLRSGKDGVQEKLKIDLKAIEAGKRKDVPLLPNDTIIVPRRIF